jgi:hypothetical protein
MAKKGPSRSASNHSPTLCDLAKLANSARAQSQRMGHPTSSRGREESFGRVGHPPVTHQFKTSIFFRNVPSVPDFGCGSTEQRMRTNDEDQSVGIMPLSQQPTSVPIVLYAQYLSLGSCPWETITYKQAIRRVKVIAIWTKCVMYVEGIRFFRPLLGNPELFSTESSLSISSPGGRRVNAPSTPRTNFLSPGRAKAAKNYSRLQVKFCALLGGILGFHYA